MTARTISHRLANWRIWIQTSFLALWLYPARLFSVCSPVFHCYACPLASFACPIGIMAQFSALHVVPFLAIGTVLVAGALFGSFICGYACPFGFLQDLIGKIPVPKFHLPRWTGFLRYGVLVGTVFVFPFLMGEKIGEATDPPPVTQTAEQPSESTGSVTGDPSGPLSGGNTSEGAAGETATKDVQGHPGKDEETDNRSPNPLFICNVCPAGALEGAVPAMVGSAADGEKVHWPNIFKIVMTALFLIAMLVKMRPWCRLICPLGAIFGLFNRASVLYMKADSESCSSCGLCKKKCRYGVVPGDELQSTSCIRCMECVTHDCSSIKAASIFSKGDAPSDKDENSR